MQNNKCMKEKIGEQWKKLGEKQVGWLHGWMIYNIHSYNICKHAV